jgi:alkylation response protein AidB-like acyl-CoA dehydrogenase
MTFVGRRTLEPEAMAAQLAAVIHREGTKNPASLRAHPELAGWSGLDLSPRTGGGWSALDMARLFSACGRYDAEYRDVIGAGHGRFLSLVSSQRFDPLLRSLAAGKSFCAIAITEPDFGSDVQGIATTAVAVEGGYRLDGIKQYISRIDECTHFIVFAGIVRDAPQKAITAFVVPRDAPGLALEPMSPAGLSSVTWGRLMLDGVTVPMAARVGGEGQALSLFVQHFTYWRTMMAALAIGSAQAAIETAASRMKTRHVFGGPIGRFSHLQQALAEWIGRLRMAWLLVEDVAKQIDQRRRPAADAAMLKAEAIEVAARATEWSMSVFGAAGYHVEEGLEKRYRDLIGLRIADGTTDVLRGQVARAFLGERLYELSLGRPTQNKKLDDMASRAFW